MKNQELLQQAIAKLPKEELFEIFPLTDRLLFEVKKSWLGKMMMITFINDKNQRVTYNHDEVLNAMLHELSTISSWINGGVFRSRDIPENVRFLAKIDNL